VDSQRQEEDDGDIEVKGEVEEGWALKDSLVGEEEKSEESKEEEGADRVEADQEEERSREESERSEEGSEEEGADQGEGSRRGGGDRRSESAEEVIEELRRRLTHEAAGPPPAWVPPVRVRTLVPFNTAGPAGSIMAVHRLSKKGAVIFVTLDGREWGLPSGHHGAPTVEILD
jgi:hypothetical protein